MSEHEYENPVDFTFVRMPLAVVRDKNLDAFDKTVYAILMSYARPAANRMEVWPSLETIAEQVPCAVSTVSESIKVLCEAGLIERHRGGPGEPARTYIKRPSVHYGAELQTSAEGESRVPSSGRKEDVDVEEDKACSCQNDTREPTSPPSKKPSLYSIGSRLATLWNTRVATQTQAPRVASQNGGVLCRAAKTFKELKDTRFADWGAEEVMDAIAERMPKMFRVMTFEQVFLAKDNPVLARLLDGQYDKQDRFDQDKARLLDGVFE